MNRMLAAVAAAVFLIVSHWAWADERQVLDSLKFQSGTVTLGGNLASLALTPDFRYLNPADTKRFLVEAWRNRFRNDAIHPKITHVVVARATQRIVYATR